MKKLAILSWTFLLALSVLQIQAQESKKASKETKTELKSERKALRKLERNGVSITAKNSFYADFGDVSNVMWKNSSYFDEATFTKNGQKMTAFYDFDGILVGTCTPKTFADVPVKAQQKIKTKYKDYTAGPVIMFDDNELNESDMMLYNIQFQDEDNYFIEMTKDNHKIVLRVNNSGDVFFFKEI
jgi:hypothetical protein